MGYLDLLTTTKGSKVLDRVQISDLDDGSVKIELSDQTGIVIDVSVIPQNEWKDMRDNLIASDKMNGSFSGCINYLAALCFLLETH